MTKAQYTEQDLERILDAVLERIPEVLESRQKPKPPTTPAPKKSRIEIELEAAHARMGSLAGRMEGSYIQDPSQAEAHELRLLQERTSKLEELARYEADLEAGENVVADERGAVVVDIAAKAEELRGELGI